MVSYWLSGWSFTRSTATREGDRGDGVIHVHSPYTLLKPLAIVNSKVIQCLQAYENIRNQYELFRILTFPTVSNTLQPMQDQSKNPHAVALGRNGGRAKSPAKLQDASANLARAHEALRSAGYPHLARARAARSAKAAARRSNSPHNRPPIPTPPTPPPHEQNPV